MDCEGSYALYIRSSAQIIYSVWQGQSWETEIHATQVRHRGENNRPRAANIPHSYHVPQVDCHILKLIPATESKSNPQKKSVACKENKKKKRKGSKYQCKNCETILDCARALFRKPPWIVPSILFQKVSFLLDFTWAWKTYPANNYIFKINIPNT